MVIEKEGPQGKHVSKAIQRYNFRERELLSIPDKSVRETQRIDYCIWQHEDQGTPDKNIFSKVMKMRAWFDLIWFEREWGENI